MCRWTMRVRRLLCVLTFILFGYVGLQFLVDISVTHPVHSVSSKKQKGTTQNELEKADDTEENHLSIRDLGLPHLLPKIFNMTDNIHPSEENILYGSTKSKKGFLTIGIRWYVEEDTDMQSLRTTIDSTIKQSSYDERRHFVIIVYIPYSEKGTSSSTTYSLHRRYSDLIEQGTILIIQPARDIYFDEIKYTRNTESHIIPFYLAKRNIDETFLYHFSRKLSHYFIELRPGSSCSKYFFAILKQYTQRTKYYWTQIHFSDDPIFSRLFPSSFLTRMADDAMKTYDRMLPDERLNSYKPYFQFPRKSIFSFFKTGNSSFATTFNNRKDLISHMRNTATNPSAELFSDMPAYEDYTLDKMYDRDPYTYFWTNIVDTGSYVTVSFNKKQNIHRVVVTTGSYINADKLRIGHLDIGKHVVNEHCESVDKQWSFEDGFLDTGAFEIFKGIRCISVTVESRQKEWLMINDLFVQTGNK